MGHYDTQLLEDIKKVSSSISNIYNQLKESEIKGLKDSDEYRNYLDYLEIALECEDEIYKKLDDDEIIKFLKMIKKNLSELYYQSRDIVLDNIDSDDEQLMINIRIALKLYNIQNKTINNTLLKGDNDILDYIFIELINRYANFHNIDILNLKYKLTFIVPKIEKYNVGNNFGSGSFVFLDKDDEQDIIMQDNNIIYGHINKIIIFIKAIQIVYMMLEISNDEVYNSKKNLVKLLSYYLSACLYYIGNQDIISIIDEIFNNYIESDEYLNNYGINYKKSIFLVRSVFKNFNKNKEYLDGKTFKIN